MKGHPTRRQVIWMPMFRPPVGSGRGDEDVSGRRRHSSRVKFLPLAWAGMPSKRAFAKMATPRTRYRAAIGTSELSGRRSGDYQSSRSLSMAGTGSSKAKYY